MAEPMEPQERLDRIVRQIAQNMVAEVCSAYVLRADGVLELYATDRSQSRCGAPLRPAPRPGPRRHHRFARPGR
jgi:signal transduction protein with GAF and PtsI domain